MAPTTVITRQYLQTFLRELSTARSESEIAQQKICEIIDDTTVPRRTLARRKLLYVDMYHVPLFNMMHIGMGLQPYFSEFGLELPNYSLFPIHLNYFSDRRVFDGEKKLIFKNNVVKIKYKYVF